MSAANYFYILSGQKFMKNAKKCSIWRVFENLKLAVKQCYQTGQFILNKNWGKLPKLKNSNETFWVISNVKKRLQSHQKWFLPTVSQCIWDFSGLIKVLKMIDEFCLLITSSSCQHWFGFSFQLYTFFQSQQLASLHETCRELVTRGKNSFKTFFSPLIQILLCMKKTKKLYCWQHHRESICP